MAVAAKSTFPVWPTYVFAGVAALALYMCFATLHGWWPVARLADTSADESAEPSVAVPMDPEDMLPRSVAKRRFYDELRKIIDATGLTLERLEQLTSSDRSSSADARLAGGDQWRRWLNGEAVPPLATMRTLVDKLHSDGTEADSLLGLWESAFAEPPLGTISEGEVPRPLPGYVRYFTGRTAELQILNKQVTQTAHGEGAFIVILIDGPAGVGKTQLALRWAHMAAAHFPDGQLYVNLRGYDHSLPPLGPDEVILDFLAALGISGDKVPTGLRAQVNEYRTALSRKRMLIVLDNARDAEQVRELLPGNSGCIAVVTSRNELRGLDVTHGPQPLKLEVLSEDDSRDLLTARIGPRVFQESQAVDDLIELCARLPLALNIVASRASRPPEVPLQDLVQGLRSETRLWDELKNLDDPSSSVDPVLSWSFKDLSSATKHMFRLLGLHAGPSISIPAAANLAGLTTDQARSLLRELTENNLIAETRGRYTFHSLLRAYAVRLADKEEAEVDKARAVQRLNSYYLHISYNGSRALGPARSHMVLESSAETTAEAIPGVTEAWAWFNAERDVLIATIMRANATGLYGTVCQLAWAIYLFLDRTGKWHDQVNIQGIAVDAAKSLGSPLALAHASRDLGEAYVRIVNYDEARKNYKQALESYKSSGNDICVAIVHNDLMILAALQDDNGEALVHAELSLKIHSKEGYEPGQAKALNGLGWLHTQLGNYEKGLDYCQRCLDMYRRINDPLNEAAAWDSLGYVLSKLTRYHEAINCFLTALDIVENIYTGYYKTEWLDHLAEAYLAIGDTDRAREKWEEANAILEQLGHSDQQKIQAKLDQLAENCPPD